MMSSEKLVVIGASAGGIEALKEIASRLPKNFPAPVLIVQHTSSSSPNILPQILSRVSPLPVMTAKDREFVRPGHIYIAPSDHHLLIESSGRLHTSRGPKENRFRPAIDPLFRSAAAAFGARAIGVILTGWLDDGTAGLWAIRQQGGTAVVQNPEEAEAPSMPLNALKHVEVNHCVSLPKIAPLLTRLASTPVKTGLKPVPPKLATEVKIAREDTALESGILEWGSPSVFACPECHGVLLQLKEGSLLRFRCHTGHAYSLESLLAEFTDKTEEALWGAIRGIEETELALERLAAHVVEHNPDAAAALQEKAVDWKRRAGLIRRALMRDEKPAEPAAQLELEKPS